MTEYYKYSEAAELSEFQSKIASIVESDKYRQIESSRDWWRNSAWFAFALLVIELIADATGII